MPIKLNVSNRSACPPHRRGRVSHFLVLVYRIRIGSLAFHSVLPEHIPTKRPKSPNWFQTRISFVGMKITDRNPATSVNGLRPSSIFAVVALATAIGAQRNELLALRLSD